MPTAAPGLCRRSSATAAELPPRLSPSLFCMCLVPPRGALTRPSPVALGSARATTEVTVVEYQLSAEDLSSPQSLIDSGADPSRVGLIVTGIASSLSSPANQESVTKEVATGVRTVLVSTLEAVAASVTTEYEISQLGESLASVTAAPDELESAAIDSVLSMVSSFSNIAGPKAVASLAATMSNIFSAVSIDRPPVSQTVDSTPETNASIAAAKAVDSLRSAAMSSIVDGLGMGLLSDQVEGEAAVVVRTKSFAMQVRNAPLGPGGVILFNSIAPTHPASIVCDADATRLPEVIRGQVDRRRAGCCAGRRIRRPDGPAAAPAR